MRQPRAFAGNAIDEALVEHALTSSDIASRRDAEEIEAQLAREAREIKEELFNEGTAERYWRGASFRLDLHEFLEGAEMPDRHGAQADVRWCSAGRCTGSPRWSSRSLLFWRRRRITFPEGVHTSLGQLVRQSQDRPTRRGSDWRYHGNIGHLGEDPAHQRLRRGAQRPLLGSQAQGPRPRHLQDRPHRLLPPRGQTRLLPHQPPRRLTHTKFNGATLYDT